MRHDDYRFEEVGTGEGAEPGRHGSKVMSDNAFHRGVTQGVDEGEGVLDEVERSEGVGFQRCTGECAAVASRVKGDGVIALRGEQR